jgi:uncharacterized protein (DUF302 family)
MHDDSDASAGFVQVQSRHSVVTTADRLELALKGAGIIVFARIDFSGDAARAGLSMHAETLLIFGNPKAGTPLMVAQPSVGLDLPLKALFWEDAEGRTWAAYNNPAYVLRRHGLPLSLAGNLSAAASFVERACRE